MATLYSAVQATPDASETVEGKLRIATNAEGLAGTNDATAMTPLKVANAIAASASGVTGALVYRGSYDASTASPNLTTASKGDFYIVSVAGSLAAQALNIGDHVVFNQAAASPITSAMFDVIDNTDAVASVNTQTGVVTLTASDVGALASGDNISELTNDAGYLTSAPVTSVNTLTGAVNLTAADVGALATGDNVSALVNDSGYLTSAPVSSVNTQTGVVTLTASDVGALASGDNISELTNDSGYITSTLSADIIVDTDGAYDLGTESARLGLTFSDLDGAVTFKASNASGAQITKGQPVYIAGVSGDVPTVALADADAAAMPCAGLAAETANSGAAIRVVSFGNLTGVNTSSFSLGDTLYIDTTAGALTATPPAGESAKLQNIGRVIRVHATSGVIKVGGAGRSAATPNLDQNKIFLGDANNRAVSTALSAIALSSFNNDLGLATVATTGAYSDLSGTPTIPTNLDGLSDVTITTATSGDLLQNNGSGQFANVAKSTIALSSFNNDLGLATVATTGAYSDLSGTPTLGTAAALNVGTSASNVVQLDGSARLPAVDGSQLTNIPSGATQLNDLSDVTITAASTGEVLRYSGVAWVDAQLAYSDLSGTPTLATVATTGAYSDLSGTPTLGTAAALNVGTSANNVVQLDGSSRLPAVDGSQLTNLPSGASYTYQAVTSASSPVTAQAWYHYSVDASGGAITINLPALSAVTSGDEIRVKITDAANDTTIDGNSTETIDGAQTQVLGVQYSAITLVAGASEWEII